MQARQPVEARFEPGQSVLFLGDHTSPGAQGYVGLLAEVLRRFRPELALRLITAGGPGQNAAALRSETLLEIVRSSHPDWVVVGIGLHDALVEPATRRMAEEYERREATRDMAAEETFGPEHRLAGARLGPESDVGHEPHLTPEFERLGLFTRNLREVVLQLLDAGVRPVLLTTVVAGEDSYYPLNISLSAYSKAIRSVGAEAEVAVVDVERAFLDVIDRAHNYKQRVLLADLNGRVNQKGEALIARTFMSYFGLLPEPGLHRPR